MGNYLEAATFDIQPGAVVGTMTFRRGLNLLSGENGTFKTKVLQALRSGAALAYHENYEPTSPRVQAISPKRNAIRRAALQIYNEQRRNDTKLEAVLNARNIDDGTFEAYPSLGDLFYVVYHDLCRDGGNQVERMNETVADFNGVIKRIFEHYELVAAWDENLGAPRISLLKHGITEVPLEGLSLGEQEILSLATYIHSSRNSFDIFLIDEPEVHLNWHLEEKLFDFLDDLCQTDDKQMIVVTHSRVAFTQRFLPKTTFLFWEDGRIKWGPELAAEQRRRLAGEAIEIIRLGAFSKPTFFVEDNCQELVVQEIAHVLDADIIVSPCGNKENVRSLYRFAQIERWPSSFFVEDGDNEGTPYTDPHFIHLDKYCIECYLLNPTIASVVTGRTEEEVRQTVLDSIVDNSDKIFRRNRFFEFLIDGLTVEHITEESLAKLDATVVMERFLRKAGLSQNEYITRYVRACHEQAVLKSVLPTAIVEVIENALTETASAEPSPEEQTAESVASGT